MSPAASRPLPRDRLGQLALAVAVHAGDAHDLALPHLERDVVGADLSGPGLDGDALELERRLVVDHALRRVPLHLVRQLGDIGRLRRLARRT